MSWATCTLGHTHWGPRGAAGLLVANDGQVLLQLRARWAHQGGTWSIPGGARERGESSVDAALREAHEELGIERASVETVGSYVAECGGWLYETVFAHATERLRLEDRAESAGHRWVAADEVDSMKLHPAFRDAWTSTTVLRQWVALTRG
jgi:8-oxo-dGTP pyrophosphatase MutT (NUDIX family)